MNSGDVVCCLVHMIDLMKLVVDLMEVSGSV
jgi:hypothetical protein